MFNAQPKKMASNMENKQPPVIEELKLSAQAPADPFPKRFALFQPQINPHQPNTTILGYLQNLG